MTSLWIKHSKVVPSTNPRRSANSSSEDIILVESTSPFNLPQVYDFNAIDMTIDARNSSETLRSYSTEKPHNFSLEASPVKKENSSLNILDSSFDVDFKTNSTSEKYVAVSNTKGLKHDHFDQQLDNFDSSAVLGIERFVSVKLGTDVFVPSKSNSVINPHRTTTVRAADDDVIHTALIREIRVLNNRLALLEQAVHRMEHNTTNPAQISDSSSTCSNESHLYRPQDVAFTIDYTNDSFAREEITYNDDNIYPEDSHDNRNKGFKFSLRRIYRAWFGKTSRKPSRVEV